MSAKRFMVDDAGTLIDIETREMYDIVEEVCPVLNALHEENQQYKQALNELKEIGDYQAQRIQELNNENTHIKTTIQTMIKNERTRIGQSVLQQLLEAI